MYHPHPFVAARFLSVRKFFSSTVINLRVTCGLGFCRVMASRYTPPRISPERASLSHFFEEKRTA